MQNSSYDCMRLRFTFSICKTKVKFKFSIKNCTAHLTGKKTYLYTYTHTQYNSSLHLDVHCIVSISFETKQKTFFSHQKLIRSQKRTNYYAIHRFIIVTVSGGEGQSNTDLGAGALALNAVPAAGEAELVVRHAGTLDKVRVLEALLAQGALESRSCHRLGACRLRHRSLRGRRHRGR